EKAVQSYENATHLDAQDADAKYNLELVKKKLEELKQQQPKQDKQQPKKQDDQEKDKQDQQDEKQKSDYSKQQQDQQKQDKNSKNANARSKIGEHEPVSRKFERLWPTRQRLGVRRPSAAFDGSARCMERPLGLVAVHWDQEPFRIPLTRPSDTLSPTGGEGWR